MLTTGYNSAAQATEILDALRTELATHGVTSVTRGRLWQLPARPCAVLIGPSVNMFSLGIQVEEARFDWLILIARDVSDHDRRADVMDTWADACMGTLLDLTRTTATFSIQGGEGPDRIEDDSLVQLLERIPERIDATMIRFSTRREIYPPPC
jgi:hypothetical protein